MAEKLDETDIFPTLLAFADGELDAVEAARALDYLIEHPEWLSVLRDHQLLRSHAHQVIRANTPAIPEAFRQQIERLAEKKNTETEASPALVSHSSEADLARDRFKSANAQSRFVRGFTPVAALIALAVGVGADRLLTRRPHDSAPPSSLAVTSIPATLVASVTGVHVNCSRFDLSQHAGSFPTVAPFDALADEVRQEFHRTVPYPDLTSIGYRFVGAGPCSQPLDDTVHLLYSAIAAGSRETLSILVQPYHGQIDLPVGKMVAPTGSNLAHPTFVWRSDHAVYFLVTDDSDSADKGRDALLAVMH